MTKDSNQSKQREIGRQFPVKKQWKLRFSLETHTRQRDRCGAGDNV